MIETPESLGEETLGPRQMAKIEGTREWNTGETWSKTRD